MLDMLEVMAHAAKSRNLLVARFDEHYLSGHDHPSTKILPFLPDLHAQLESS